MSIKIAMLGRGDCDVLKSVAAGVFDHEVRADLCEQFLCDPRHHLAVAVDLGVVVGMGAAVHYIHPDKPAELWINEVGVARAYRNRGIAQQLLRTLLNVGKEHGCTEAWVLTDRSNIPAMRLYASCGGSEGEHDQVTFTFKINGTLPDSVE